MKTIQIINAAIIASTLSTVASADLVVGYNFNELQSGSPVPATYAADHGIGMFSTNFVAGDVVHFSGSSVGRLPEDANGRGAAFRVGEGGRNNGSYAQFAFDSTGFGDMTLTFATKTTARTGFTSMDIQVSGNGVDFTTIETLENLRDDSNWLLKTVDLTGAAVLEDNADAVIRVVFAGGDASNATANTRLENFIIDGSPVPTPASAALLGLGGLVATRRRRA